MFGIREPAKPDAVNIQNFQGVYLSPQQAKALLNVLQQNVAQYESAFGEIRLEPGAGADPGRPGHSVAVPAGSVQREDSVPTHTSTYVYLRSFPYAFRHPGPSLFLG